MRIVSDYSCPDQQPVPDKIRPSFSAWSDPMDKVKNLAFILFVFAFAAFAAQEDNRLVVDPTIVNYDSFPAVKTGRTFFVDMVKDTARARGDSGFVGNVNTRLNHPIAVICQPFPAAAVGRSLETILTKRGALTADSSAATYIIRVSVLDFALKETPHFFYQTLEATVRFRIDLVDPRTSQPVQRFTIDSQRSRSVFNSRRNSVKVIRDALQNAVGQVIQTLNGL